MIAKVICNDCKSDLQWHICMNRFWLICTLVLLIFIRHILLILTLTLLISTRHICSNFMTCFDLRLQLSLHLHADLDFLNVGDEGSEIKVSIIAKVLENEDLGKCVLQCSLRLNNIVSLFFKYIELGHEEMSEYVKTAFLNSLLGMQLNRLLQLVKWCMILQVGHVLAVSGFCHLLHHNITLLETLRRDVTTLQGLHDSRFYHDKLCLLFVFCVDDANALYSYGMEAL